MRCFFSAISRRDSKNLSQKSYGSHGVLLVGIMKWWDKIDKEWKEEKREDKAMHRVGGGEGT